MIILSPLSEYLVYNTSQSSNSNIFYYSRSQMIVFNLFQTTDIIQFFSLIQNSIFGNHFSRQVVLGINDESNDRPSASKKFLVSTESL